MQVGQQVARLLVFYFSDQRQLVQISFPQIFICILHSERARDIHKLFEPGESPMLHISGEVLMHREVGIVVHFACVEGFPIFSHLILFIRKGV